MIKVTVELISAISPTRNKLLGTLEICNVGGTKYRGDYECRIIHPSGKKGVIKRVTGYPRLTLSMWHLITRALTALEYTK